MSVFLIVNFSIGLIGWGISECFTRGLNAATAASANSLANERHATRPNAPNKNVN
jgi:hypothetical protein